MAAVEDGFSSPETEPIASTGQRGRVSGSKKAPWRSVRGLFNLLSIAFLLSALLGLGAAYDRSLAYGRLGMIAIGVGMGMLLARRGSRRHEAIGPVLGLGALTLGVTVSVLFWIRDVNPLALTQFLSAVIQPQWLAQIPWPSLHANAVGGALALLLPPGMAACYWAWQRRAWATTLILTAALLVVWAGLLASASRGAWIGLGSGFLILTLVGRRQRLSWPSWGDWAVLVGSWLLLCALFYIVVWQVQPDKIGVFTHNIVSVDSRLRVWRNMAMMIGDYPLTGSGLASTPAVYSAYVLLIHVPYLNHAHNLYLQVAVEQGIPALCVFLGMVGLATWRLLANRPQDGETWIWWRAALVSLVVLIVHGFLDAELYVSRLVPLLFLPMGMAFAVGQRRADSILDRQTTTKRRSSPIAVRVLIVLLIATLIATFLRSPVQAIVWANLGSVAQTGAELSLYRWPAWPIQDAVRRTQALDLEPAVAYYQTALRTAPSNPTANWRLGQIKLALGDYEAACTHLETAFGAAPYHRAVRQLWAECLAIRGETEAAATLWQTLDLDLDQLALRQWWYTYIGEPARADLLYAAAKDIQ